jgi:hypothetical protein
MKEEGKGDVFVVISEEALINHEGTKTLRLLGISLLFLVFLWL